MYGLSLDEDITLYLVLGRFDEKCKGKKTLSENRRKK